MQLHLAPDAAPVLGPPLIDVFVHGKPITQGSTERGKAGHAYHSHEKVLLPWRERIEAVVRSVREANGIETIPAQVPVVVELTFVIPRPPSAPKSRTLPTTRPAKAANGGGDIDKMTRAVLDAIGFHRWTVKTGKRKGEVRQRGAALMADDSQVICTPVSSVYARPGEQPGVRIRAWRPDPDALAAGWVPRASWEFVRRDAIE